jgi:hypothetical protein
MLAVLAGAHAEVALVIADEYLADMPAVDFLARTHGLHARAKRILLIYHGDWSPENPAVLAIAVGKIDYYLYAPWYPLEQGLYPAMTEFLAAWDKSREPSFAAFRIVGPARSPRAHRLRDDLARAGVPYWSFDNRSEEGRRLLREHNLEGTPLPVVLAQDGTVLVDPSHEDLLATLGMPSALGTRTCDVAIIGAGPAGLAAAVYAAIHLSKYAASVTMVVRGPDLAASMSSYLVTEISKTANIRVRPSTEVTGGDGQCSLETLTLRHRISDAIETVPAAALFVMIGAEPRTSWLPGSIERDDEGFIRTGRDLHRAVELPAAWPLKRSPLMLETSIPGVFAAGDVRHRSVKRVASAVGEGATVIQLVHEHLRAEHD